MTSINATELARRLSDILNRVLYRGEAFLIERNGETVAQLTGPDRGVTGPTLGELVAELPRFRSHDPSFAEDLEAVHARQQLLETSPWDS